ncbi:hypothetical protein [Granulicella sp. dw_53]|uniref:hypothetical protein n=1 Tax=Granulicella sp. dw_53 TaxID=2719792 RepID=UPI001BD548C9|nr:hypothetical protein [Granulicella sp. dw_53]
MDDESRMTAGDAAEEFERRVVRALERQPAVRIPAGFAARVASQAPVRIAATAAVRRTRYGFGMVWVGMVLLLVAMLGLAPRAGAGSAVWVGLEWVLCGQFILLAMWSGMRRDWMR